MDFTTPVKIASSPSISYGKPLFAVGSCFASAIGNKLREHSFDILINPCGVIYNPLSIARLLDRIIERHIYTADDLVQRNSLWCSFDFHSSFASTDKEATLHKMNAAIAEAHCYLQNASHILITFGSSVVYERDGQPVVNCHKFPANHFVERRLSIEEITHVFGATIDHLRRFNPSAKIIFTVSPVRYLGKGAHAGRLNKAVLLLAVDNLCAQHACSYFDAYEIMMDELRDYRYYADDMIHPSSLAIEYIWERFLDTYTDASTRELSRRAFALRADLNHRPLHPDSDEYRHFKEKTEQKIALWENESGTKIII